MSTLALAPTTGRPSLTRLTGVELRKMVDTCAGLWLQLAVVALTVVVVAVTASTGDPDDTFRGLLNAAVQPAAVLLPVVGILLVASEWSQRTALITFTLVPQRSRVLLAKLGASVVLAAAALALSLVVAAAGTLVASPGVDGAWSLPAGIVGQLAVYLATGMITGVAFGAVLLASAPAIVVYFALPLTWSALGTLAFFEGAAGWLDSAQTGAVMGERLMSADDWARVATTLALWMLVPLAIGAWRIVRSEVRAT